MYDVSVCERGEIMSVVTICMSHFFRGLEGSSDYNTCNHEHEVDLRNIHLAPVLSGSMHNLNSWETTQTLCLGYNRKCS